jgi:hypothetical protein
MVKKRKKEIFLVTSTAEISLESLLIRKYMWTSQISIKPATLTSGKDFSL